MSFPLRFAALAFGAWSTSFVALAEISLKETPGRIRVELDGQLLTEYRFDHPDHVYFYPLIGPGGAKMTRSWPMEDVPGEEHDHPHHRSLWFAHGAVNGIDFWSEPASHKSPPKTGLGHIVHEKFLELKGGKDQAVISDLLKWVGPDGQVVLTSEQTFRIYAQPDQSRLFDFEVTLKAGEKEVVFGDTKEGSMALRIAESMRLMKSGKKPGEGHIMTSEGQNDADAWGKRARWVDMSGPVDGKTLGIAILEHPENPRSPTRWHARDYGLFAANPFCEADMDKSQSQGAGDFKIAPGQSAKFRYRIFLHEGNATEAKVAERFAAYAK